MPIPSEILIRTLVPRILTPATTVAELLYLFAEQPNPGFAYAVRISNRTHPIRTNAW